MNKPRILVSPLNWGLGHASRCIPIVQKLLELRCEVLLGGDGQALRLLKKEFPNLSSFHIPDHKIEYPAKGGLLFPMIRQLPDIMRQIKKEHLLLQELVVEEEVDAVLSDNRYGLYSKRIPSIILTHQITPASPLFKGFVGHRIRKLLGNFDHCWVPDFQGKDSLAGKLTRGAEKLNNVSFIGPLSRFHKKDSSGEYKFMVVLSGPEPRRSQLESELMNLLGKCSGRHVLIRGSESHFKLRDSENIEVKNIARANELEALMDASEFLISRSGYSSIMDFKLKGRSALLIPTPGQYEQEYLADYHKNGNHFLVQEQGHVNLEEAAKKLKSLKKVQAFESSRVDQFLKDFFESLY